MSTTTNPTRQDAINKVREVLDAIPKGSHVFIDYKAAGKPSVDAREVAEKSRAAGIPATHYYGTFEGWKVTNAGEPIFFMTVHNRQNELRSFNPFRGELRDIKVLRVGPGEQAAA